MSRHDMPFGAALVDGGVRFRLWAPAQEDLVLLWRDAYSSTELPMTRIGDGWFETIAKDAGVGSLYGFRLQDGLQVPDPAARFQPQNVHGLSEVIDPDAYPWKDDAWRGRPWHETVLYELHLGSFTPAGTFRAAIEKLPHLVALGITAIELMPVASFPGRWNWGYDGVLPFAMDERYGRPDDLKALVDAAHGQGLMVFLDVVYNHFGPEGNYLHCYAPQFFSTRHQTPWGAAINFDDSGSNVVRSFFIHNALYWLEEFHLDGLRLDAVHAIVDDSEPDVLYDLAQAVAKGPGRAWPRHLVLENELNEAHYLVRDSKNRPRHFTAQWNDDAHHALHVILTGEEEGYYIDYAKAPRRQLGRCLTEGFAFQGDPSPYRNGALRGESSCGLPPTAFVNFLQNHDQIGNRAFGERITQLTNPEALRAATAILLLAPQPPLLFMGQEWASPSPFPFFCDFEGELAAAVTHGRRQEFARFPAFSDPARRAHIPDPNNPATFESAVLNWQELERPEHQAWLAIHRDLLALRRQEIVPRLSQGLSQAGFQELGDQGLVVTWDFKDGSRVRLITNLSATPLSGIQLPAAKALYSSGSVEAGVASPWSVFCYLEKGA